MIAVKHITVTLIVVALAACSKSHDTSPAFVPEQSYITGTIEGNVNDSAIYALVLQPNGMAKALSIEKSPDATYEYKNNHLKFMLAGSSEGFDFTISGNTITDAASLTHTMAAPNTSILQKVPASDAFSGKTFTGNLKLNGHNTPDFIFTFRFDGGKFAFSTDGQPPTLLDKDYALQNNAVATTSAGNQKFLFVIVNGKLAVSFTSGVLQFNGELHPAA